jgi:2-methylcitrate dehydratase PrpD
VTSASSQIAWFAAGFDAVPITAQQRHLAYRALLDTYAVAIAGRHEAAPRVARDTLRELAGIGNATDWMSGEHLPAESAAWLNGIAAHVLDYDDVMTAMRGHVSVALVPPLIALAEAEGLSGSRFSAAYLAGFEVLAKLSRVMAIPHYSKGWHSTLSLGVIGSTVACSVLLQLDQAQTENAIGLAVSQAAGTRENFGTMAKSFHAGQCAGAAVRAARLAQAGFTASVNAIDGKYGYLALYAGGEDPHAQLETLGRAPLEIDSMGIDVKKYPCCYATHRALDALLTLRNQHGLTVADIDTIEVNTSAGGLDALISAPPRDGLEAKFSMEYTLAAALIDGRIELSTFDSGRFTRPQIQKLLARVALREAPGSVLPRWSEVSLHLKNGQRLARRVQVARGDAGDPLSDDELIAKVEDCFAYGRFGANAREIAFTVFGMAKTRVSDVLRPVYGSTRARMR